MTTPDISHKKRLQFTAWLPTIIIMILIFSFSAKEAVESAQTSSRLLDVLTNALENIFHISILPDSATYDTLHVIVRKFGHLSEYMALGLFTTFPLHLHGLRRLRLLASCELLCVFYACTDEFHQIFVPGRDGNLVDVTIDSTGALAGIGIAFLLLHFVRKIRMRNITQSRL